MKKFIVVFLSICLALGACSGAFAAGPTFDAAAEAESKTAASVPVKHSVRTAALKPDKPAVQPESAIAKDVIIRFLTIIKNSIQERLQKVEKTIEGLYRDRTFIIMLRPPPDRQKEYIQILTLRIRYYEEYERPRLQKQLKEITELIDKLKKEK